MKRPTIAAMVLLCMPGLVLFSCRKNTTSDDQQQFSTVKNLGEVFDKFWDGVNKNYLFWDTDTTDWDRIYRTYKPLFSNLNIKDTADLQTSISYFKAMTYGLKDGHFQIIFEKPQNINLYPAFIRKQGEQDFHLPFDFSNIDTSYFDPGYITGFDSTTHPGSTPLRARFATIHKNTVYFGCNSFSLSKAYRDISVNGVKAVLDSFFTVLNRDNATIKELILDVRNNFGGDLTDLNFLVGHFIEKPLHFGYSRYKSGIGRLDYTSWIAASIRPQPNAVALKCPIIVLTDGYSVSTAEQVAMAIGALPNGVTVGETTWGATGALVSNEVYNDGQFVIPGFMTVYMSSIEFEYINNRSYEEKGFPPDVSAPFYAQAAASGRDPQLEKAMGLIH